MTPADTLAPPASRRAAILADASRHLDRLARQVDHDWPTLRYRYTPNPRTTCYGQGTPPPGFHLDESSARAQALGDAAMVYASAAARQSALPYWTHADERRRARAERLTFAVATGLGPMTDWRQHRGQDAGARIRGALRRAAYFHAAALRAVQSGGDWRDLLNARDAAELALEGGWSDLAAAA